MAKPFTTDSLALRIYIAEQRRWYLACQEGFAWDEVNEIV